jgi:hypothetical protein
MVVRRRTDSVTVEILSNLGQSYTVDDGLHDATYHHCGFKVYL